MSKTGGSEADKKVPKVESENTRKDPTAGAGVGASGDLNLLPGEELTALSRDEMASVCAKLEAFARSNPGRAGTREDRGGEGE